MPAMSCYSVNSDKEGMSATTDLLNNKDLSLSSFIIKVKVV